MRLADGAWHRLALSLSADQLEITLDCRPVHTRVIRPLHTRLPSPANLTLWLGIVPRHRYYRNECNISSQLDREVL